MVFLFVWGFSSHSRIFQSCKSHHYRWRAATFDLCSAFIAIEQWGFLGFELPTFRLRGESSNRLRHRRGDKNIKWELSVYMYLLAECSSNSKRYIALELYTWCNPKTSFNNALSQSNRVHSEVFWTSMSWRSHRIFKTS